MIIPAEYTWSTRATAPHVTVVVPCYNYGKFLTDCVRSIVSQAWVTTSVNIIDDASTDGSFAVAERLAATYPQVTATRHRINRGHIATYNEGLEAADSDYVVLLSADDQLAPGSLSRATALMEAHPNVGLVYGHPQTFSEEPSIGGQRVRNWTVWAGHQWIQAQFSRGLSIIYSPEAVVRTRVQHQVGYYRTSLPHSGDLEMWLRIAEIADVGRVNGPDQAYRRVHPASMMQSQFGSVPKDLAERFRAYESFLASSRLPERHVQRLGILARRRTSSEAFGWAAASRGQCSPDELNSAVAFAKEIYPEYQRLNTYRIYIASLGSSYPTFRPSVALGRVEENLAARIRWRRWRRYGI